MDTQKRNIIIYDMITGTKFTLCAAKTSIRDNWLNQSGHLIQQAKKELSKQLASHSSHSSSEPVEPFTRKSSMFRKEREGSGSRRKGSRPGSSTGVRVTSPASEEMVGIN